MKNNSQKKQIFGHILACVTQIMWGATFVSTKVLLTCFQPVEILFIRMLLAFAALFLVSPHIFKIREKKREAVFAGAALCGLVLYFLLENTALPITYASNVGIIGGSNVTGTNLCILMLAILVASIGLNMNSTAVIIGAMLISPLMGSIQAMGYSVAASDLNQLKRSGTGFLFQIMICLITSTLYFRLSPISTQTSELLARTQPNVWDVLIACCGGLAGMIGVTRIEKSNVIPGVAIATALMPPLCTCGYGIAHSNIRIAPGAGYLFLVNTYFIFLASVLVLVLLNIPKEGSFTAEQRKKSEEN